MGDGGDTRHPSSQGPSEQSPDSSKLPNLTPHPENSTSTSQPARKPPEQEAQEHFDSMLGKAMQAQAQDQLARFNFSEKIKEMQARVDALEQYTDKADVEWLFAQLSKDSSKDVLQRIVQLDRSLQDVKRNQRELLGLMKQPALVKADVNAAQLAKVFGDYDMCVRDVAQLKQQLDVLSERTKVNGETVQTVGNLQNASQEVQSLRNQVDMLQNTLYTLNRKVDLVNPEQRIVVLENKLKEVLEYLHASRGQHAKVVQVPNNLQEPPV